MIFIWNRLFLFNTSIFIHYIILCSIQNIHSMHTYLFNTDVFIQYQYNYSMHHILFNTNIFIQYRHIYSIQIFIFNNPGPSAAKSHDLLSILAGSTSCQGFTHLSHGSICCEVKVAFNSLEMAVV